MLADTVKSKTVLHIINNEICMGTNMPNGNKALLCRDLVHSKCIMGSAWQQQEVCLSYYSPEDRSHIPCRSSLVDSIITGTITMFHSVGPNLNRFSHFMFSQQQWPF